jgi:adenylate cyclase
MQDGSLKCGTCATPNPPTARFCMECGAPLAQACPACGTEAPPEARFCPSCGTALADGPPAPTPSSARPERRPDASVEERRRVTILFADLSGYTAVSERLDPEEVRQIADRSLRRLAAEVDRFGGTIDKYIGDNVMAIFGAPVAHEDDPERAVRSGLAMQAAMEEINGELEPRHGVRFQLRVGINTGEVLAGEVAGSYTVIGDAVNVAARLQAAGSPGTVVVGELTRAATRDAVLYRPLEPLTLKGKASPVAAWEAIEPLAPSPAAREAGDAPLVGRAHELGLLESAYLRAASEGRPHLVTVVGAAGVGKSRLLCELIDRLSAGEAPPVVRQGRCLAYGSGTVYSALGDIMRAECEIEDTDSAAAAWEKLERRVEALAGEGAADTAAIVGRVLGMEPPAGRPDPVQALDRERLRERFFAGAQALVEGMSRECPLVLALEDIHWADQGMLDLVEHLARWGRGPVLIVAATRDQLLERRASWGSGRRATVLFLDPLSPGETRELVQALMPDGAGAAAAVAERAEGNPLFAEEMVRRLADGSYDSVAELPDTVHAVLAARLDSLAPVERRVVQQAAVIGRTFSTDTLRALANGAEDGVRGVVHSLADKDLFVPGTARGPAGDLEMSFKHVLIRDVAYGMLPRATRARSHLAVGRFLEQRAGGRADEIVVVLAEHYARAAALGAQARLDESELGPMREAARGHLEAAGDAAARFFSNEEALDHYTKAVELLDDPAAGARVAEKQGDAALRLGRTEAALEAWRSCLDHHRSRQDLPLVGRTLRKIGAALTQQGERVAAIEHYQQGMNLLKDGPPSPELVRLYEDAAWLYVQSGDNMLAIYASEKALRLAQQLGEAAAVSRAHGIFGRVFSRIGDTERARENLEKAVDSARASDDPLEEVLALIALAGHLEVAEAAYEAAEDSYREALSAAERIGDVPSQVELHSALAQLAVHRADWDAVRRLSDASAQLAEGAGLVLKLCLPFALRGLLAWRDGDWERAEGSYRRAAELAEDVGWSEVAFASLSGLAVTQRDRGDYDAAVVSLDHALAIADRGGLIVQSIIALAAKAVALMLAGRPQEGGAAAQEAADISRRLHSPVGEVAALEAEGATAPPREATALLAQARDGWRELGRPLDAARCELLAATVLASSDRDGATELATASADAFEALGVPHLARRAREALS